MGLPLITILIRTSKRPQLFARCYDSVKNQTYKNIRVIVSYDNYVARTYIPAEIETIPVFEPPSREFFYDLYCNDLKAMVTNGWFMFLDDDDYLRSPTIIQELSAYITDFHGCIIFPMLRNGIGKPRKNYIRQGLVEEGKIGLPCALIHSEYKNLADLDGHRSGDFRFIKSITGQVPTRFITLVVVVTDRRSFGVME